MYPDWALPEFYPRWLIEEASNRCRTLDEIHEFAGPVMRHFKGNDPGRERGMAFIENMN